MNTKHLKAKILDLAIRGKLVPQDSSEGNAADLLKEHNYIPKEEIPFEIPKNWCWCRLSEISNSIIAGGDRPAICTKEKTSENIIPIYANAIEKDGLYGYTNKPQITEKAITISARGTIGFSCIREHPFVPIVRLIVLVPNPSIINLKYLKASFDALLNMTEGSSIPQLTIPSIKTFLFPLPPLSEQQRIVSATEKAFEQIDIIEKNKLSLKTYIKQTKSKVLDLAIHGKLVKQNPGEGNAFELLEKIRKEKNELIKQKKLKEDKKSSFIIKAEDGKHYEQFTDGSLKDIEDEIPFEIPENWCWCRFKELFKVINGDRGKNYPAKSTLSHSGIPFISALNLKNNTVYKDEDLLCLSQKQYDRLGSGKLNKDDMVLCIRGSIGKHGFFPFEQGAIASSLVIIREYTQTKYFSKLLDYYLKSAFFFEEIKRFDNGTAQPNLAAESLSLFYFPLPPLSEQQRIVKKIKQVFEQLDILEKSFGE